MRELTSAADRDDGKPWVPWKKGCEYYGILPGHRQRITCTAWWDPDRQSLLLTMEEYDESMAEFEPCWAQLRFIPAGPFDGCAEVLSMAHEWADSVSEAFDLPGKVR